jgi:hypothetical protein
MKQIGSIHIDDAPIGMLIKDKKQNRFYLAVQNGSGEKEWRPCPCPGCSNPANAKKKGGAASTNLAPSPEQHSWHHHHAPFYQVFNNYVCVKRDTLGEIRDFFMEMFSQKNYLERKIPFT